MRFHGDDRGVSELLGAILVFGLVIAVLAIFQVNAIPADNAEVEFTHDQAAQSDFQLVRTAIIESAGADEPRSAVVDLGVTYPNRLVFVNPGPVAGQLRTVDAGAYDTNNPSDVNLYKICGFGDGGQAVDTKSLEYSVDYNVYAGDPVLQYENSIVHQRYANSDADLVRNDQRIVRDNTISLFPLAGDIAYSGTNSQSIDFVSAGTSLATRDVSNQWVLYVPTSLSADTWRNSDQLLAGELSKNVVSVDEGTAGDGRIEVTMQPGTYNFRCTVIGVNETPTGVTPIDDTGGDDADDTGEINPVSDDSLKYVGSKVEADDTVTVTWQNIGSSPIAVDAVRFPFYNADSQGNSGGSTATDGTFDGIAVEVGGQYEDTPGGMAYTVDAGATFQATIEFYCGVGDQFLPGTGDYFAVALETTVGDTTSRDNYFVTPISDRSGNSNRCSSGGPTAAFDYTPSSPSVGQSVTFDASTSTTTGSTSYEWDFDGDGTTDQTGLTVTHSFTSAGSHPVELTVTDNKGTHSTSDTVTVGAVTLSASLEITKSGSTYTLDATGSSGTITEYRWDFTNDGSIDQVTTDPTITRTYTGATKPTEARVVVSDGSSTRSATYNYP